MESIKVWMTKQEKALFLIKLAKKFGFKISRDHFNGIIIRIGKKEGI